MNMEAISARQFWEGMMVDVIAQLSDEDVVRYAQEFSQPGNVFVLELTNHSVQRVEKPSTAKKLEVSNRCAILDNTLLDKIAPQRKPTKGTPRRKS
jgi:hypothetical protein